LISRPKKKAAAARVEAVDAGPVKVPRRRALAALAERVLRQEGVAGQVNLVFCEDAHVRELNRRYRKLDKVTDVLSFIYEDEDVFGEIYIATAQALKQAPRWRNTFFEELKRLVVHGALHVAGYDHMRKNDRTVMRAKEDFYCALKT
jgi:probable rRNA maturation factor